MLGAEEASNLETTKKHRQKCPSQAYFLQPKGQERGSKPLAKPPEKRETIQNSNNRNERKNITTDPTDTKGVIREFYKQLYTHIFTTYTKWINSLETQITTLLYIK